MDHLRTDSALHPRSFGGFAITDVRSSLDFCPGTFRLYQQRHLRTVLSPDASGGTLLDEWRPTCSTEFAGFGIVQAMYSSGSQQFWYTRGGYAARDGKVCCFGQASTSSHEDDQDELAQMFSYDQFTDTVTHDGFWYNMDDFEQGDNSGRSDWTEQSYMSNTEKSIDQETSTQDE